VPTIHRILVAIRDPYARSIPALTKAAQLAQALGARLELFHALTYPIYSAYEQGFKLLEKQERTRVLDRLQQLADRLKNGRHRAPSDVCVHATWDTPAYEAVIRRATETRADLIIAGVHPGAHFGASLLRMGDWELLRRSPIPVLIVKRSGRYRRPAMVLAAVDPTHAMDKPARLDDCILALAGDLSSGLGARLHTVHATGALEPLPRPQRALTAEAAAARYRRLLSEQFARYQHLLDRHHVPRARRHLLNIPPSDAIQDVAGRLHADLVVVGAMSRRGWQRLLVGNTAEALLDPLSCDLLVVKPPRFKLSIPKQPVGPLYQLAVPLAP